MSSWRYYRGKENTSVMVPRGLRAMKLLENELRWSEPDWLKDQVRWPAQMRGEAGGSSGRNLKKKKNSPRCCGRWQPSEKIFWPWIIAALQLVTAWLLRFIAITRSAEHLSGPLTQRNFNELRRIWLKQYSDQHFLGKWNTLQKESKCEDIHCIVTFL